MNPYLGDIILFGGNFAIRGYAKCEGQLLSTSNHSALFSILGIQYGGDGRSTFALPKKENPKGGGIYLIAVEGMYPSRS